MNRLSQTGWIRIAAAVAVCLMVALWWSAIWRDVDDTALGRVPALDEAYYLRAAADIADGEILPAGPLAMSPLYPYLVALAGGGRELSANGVLTGGAPTGLRILQALLWAGTGALLFLIGRRRLPPGWAWLPPLLYLLYRPAAVMVSSALLETALTFCVTATLCAISATRDSGPTIRRGIAIGILAGAASLLRANAVVLVLVGAAALLFPGDGGRERGGAKNGAGRTGKSRGPALALLVAAAAMLSPAIIFNSSRAGRLVGPSLNGGVNLYIGNSPGANGFFRTFPGYDATDDPAGIGFLSREKGVPDLDEAEADRIWTSEAWGYIQDDPARAAGLWLHKFRLHFAAVEISQITPLEAWPRHAPWLKAAFLPYGLISALGITGLVLVVCRRRRLRSWAATLLLLAATQSVFFMVSRYRLAMVPILALLGAAAVAELARSRGRKLAAGLMVMVLAALAVAPWGLADTTRKLAAAGACNEAGRWQSLGIQLKEDGDPGAARSAWLESERLLRGAIERQPEITLGWRGLSRSDYLLGSPAAAEQTLLRGLERAAHPQLLRGDLVRLLLARGAGAEALPYMERYLREAPADVSMLHNYTVALAGAGRIEAALAAAAELIAAAPADPRGYSDRGVVLGRAGRLEEAVAAFSEGLDRVPGDQTLLANLGYARSRLAAAADPDSGDRPD